MMCHRYLVVLLILQFLVSFCRNDHVDEVAHINSEAAALLKVGKPKEAMQLLHSLSDQQQMLYISRLNEARALAQLNDFKSSETILLDLIKNEQDAEEKEDFLLALLTISKLYILSKRFNEAEIHLKTIISLEETHSQAYLFLGKVYLSRDEDQQKAKAYIEKAYQLEPDDDRINFELAVILLITGEFARAKQFFDRSSQLNEKLDHKLVAKLYIHYNQIQFAHEELKIHLEKKAQENTSEFDLDAYLLMAQCNEHLGYTEEAKAQYEAVLKHKPSEPVALAGLGLLTLGIGTRNFGAIHACGLNQDRALTYLRTANSLRPGMKPVEEALAFCQREIEEVKAWRKIVQSFQNSSSINNTTVTTSSNKNGVIKQIIASLLKSISSVKKYVGILFRFGRKAATRKISKAELIETTRKRWEARESQYPQNISQITWPGLEIFYEEYILNNKPAIIKNFQKSWILSSLTPKERIEYLLKAFGSNVVRVSVSPSGRFDGPENGTLWGLSPDKDVLVRPPATSMLLRDCLEVMTREDIQETFYLEYLALHQYLGQEFVKLVEPPLPIQTTREGLLEHLVSNVWLGSKPTTSPLHYDDYENFLCQLLGEKEVLLFPPSDYPYLYYLGRPKGKLLYEYPNNFTRDVKTGLDQRSIVFGSSIIVDAPDLIRYKLYQKASPQLVTLKPGDCLYLPPFWHHEVQSLPDNITGFNLAVNFWFRNVTYPFDEWALLRNN